MLHKVTLQGAIKIPYLIYVYFFMFPWFLFFKVPDIVICGAFYLCIDGGCKTC